MTTHEDPFADPGRQVGQGPGQQGGQGPDAAPAYGTGGYGTPASGPRNGFGLTALITGTVGLVFGVLPFSFPLGMLLGVVAIVFGVLGRKRAKRSEATNGGQALAGLICGTVALVAGIAWTTFFTVLVSDKLHHCAPGYANSRGMPETYSTSC